MPTRIFLDAKFTSLENPELISIGLTSETGEQFYMESNEFSINNCSPFCYNKIIPLIEPIENRYTYHSIRDKILTWLNQFSDIIIFVDNGLDIQLFVNLISEVPTNIMHAYNISDYIEHTCKILWFNIYPNEYQECAKKITNVFFSRVQQYYRINNKEEYLALNDSKANRFAFLDIEKYFNYPVSQLLNKKVNF